MDIGTVQIGVAHNFVMRHPGVRVRAMLKRVQAPDIGLDELHIDIKKTLSLQELRQLGRELLKDADRHNKLIELVRSEIAGRLSTAVSAGCNGQSPSRSTSRRP
jgi:hypothetical protein